MNCTTIPLAPTIADMQRENPMFKEAVKLGITPMITSLTLMQNAESESEVLGLGLSVIVLNIGNVSRSSSYCNCWN